MSCNFVQSCHGYTKSFVLYPAGTDLHPDEGRTVHVRGTCHRRVTTTLQKSPFGSIFTSISIINMVLYADMIAIQGN